MMMKVIDDYLGFYGETMDTEDDLNNEEFHIINI